MRWLLLALLLIAGTASAAGPKQIIWIISDDQSQDTVSAYGTTIYTAALATPNIDRIATAGARFNSFFYVHSTCSPSRSQMYTGMYYTRIGAIVSDIAGMKADVPTVFDELQGAGYRTAIFGKFNLTGNTGDVPSAYGFTDYDILNFDAAGQGTYDAPQMLNNYGHTSPSGRCGGSGSNATPETNTRAGYSTRVITTCALEWLAAHNGEKVAVVIALKGPHDPMVYEDCTRPSHWDDEACYAGILPGGVTPTDFVHPSTWDDVIPRAGRTSFGVSAQAQLLTQFGQWQAGNYQLSRASGGYGKALYTGPVTVAAEIEYQYQTQLKDYLRTLHSVDVQTGRVLDYVRDNGLTPTTLLIWNADNGYILGEHGGSFGKGTMYEESMKGPLLIQYPCTSCGTAPAITAGSTNSDLVANIDLAPTILEFAEVSVPSRMQGRSLVNLTKPTPVTDWRKTVYYHDTSGIAAAQRGVRSSRYKLIYYPDDTFELIDLGTDPGERTDVHAVGAYADTITWLQSQMYQWEAIIGEGRGVSGGKLLGGAKLR